MQIFENSSKKDKFVKKIKKKNENKIKKINKQMNKYIVNK